MRNSSTNAIDGAEQESGPQRSTARTRVRRLRDWDVPPSRLARFREACGQTTAYIIRISSSESGHGSQAFLWDRPALIVGRGADCDLRLPHPEISRQHAYFQILGDRIYCADLASRTGTHWSNGASQSGWVTPDEPVSLGPYSLTFEPTPFVHPAADPASADEELAEFDDSGERGKDDDRSGNSFWLHFVNAGQAIRRYRVTRDVTLIGSSDNVKIHLSHPSVSNVHCSVVRTPAGLWIVDLLSADGTIINGHVEPLAPLREGIEFQVGRFLVEVHQGDDVDPPFPTRPSSQVDRSSNPHDGAQSADGEASAPPEQQLGRLSALNELAHLTAHRPHADGVPAPAGGLSEQFVLSIIKELGVMQQQALQHAQESMRETVHQLSQTYQERLDALERQHTALRDQLSGMSSGQGTRHLPEPGFDRDLSEGGWNQSPSNGAPGFDDEFPGTDHDPIDDIDPADREQWIRDQIKSVEVEIEKAHRGWGRKLIDLLGY